MGFFNEYNPEFGVVFDELDDILSSGGGGGGPQYFPAPGTGDGPLASKPGANEIFAGYVTVDGIRYQLIEDAATGKFLGAVNLTNGERQSNYPIPKTEEKKGGTGEAQPPNLGGAAFTEQQMRDRVAQSGGELKDYGGYFVASYKDGTQVRYDPSDTGKNGIRYNGTLIGAPAQKTKALSPLEKSAQNLASARNILGGGEAGETSFARVGAGAGSSTSSDNGVQAFFREPDAVAGERAPALTMLKMPGTGFIQPGAETIRANLAEGMIKPTGDFATDLKNSLVVQGIREKIRNDYPDLNLAQQQAILNIMTGRNARTAANYEDEASKGWYDNAGRWMGATTFKGDAGLGKAPTLAALDNIFAPEEEEFEFAAEGDEFTLDEPTFARFTGLNTGETKNVIAAENPGMQENVSFAPVTGDPTNKLFGGIVNGQSIQKSIPMVAGKTEPEFMPSSADKINIAKAQGAVNQSGYPGGWAAFLLRSSDAARNAILGPELQKLLEPLFGRYNPDYEATRIALEGPWLDRLREGGGFTYREPRINNTGTGAPRGRAIAPPIGYDQPYSGDIAQLDRDAYRERGISSIQKPSLDDTLFTTQPVIDFRPLAAAAGDSFAPPDRFASATTGNRPVEDLLSDRGRRALAVLTG